MDLRPERLAGLAAAVFPVFERSGAHSEFRRDLFLSCACSQSLIQQQLAQMSLLIIEKWRIVPYGLDQKMAKGAQKGPLPPLFAWTFEYFAEMVLPFSLILPWQVVGNWI